MDLEEPKRRLLVHLRREISDERLLEAMKRVPREAFVPEASWHLAYENIPIPIGEEQTISQPLIVAMMIEAIKLNPTDKVLELGAGSGYEAALLSLLAREVITTERLPVLASGAESLLASMSYDNVAVRLAGETLGCPEKAPYDAIIVAAGAPHLPMVLLDQLEDGGRMVIPVGPRWEQDLLRVEKTAGGYSVNSMGPCRFVPLIGPGAWEDEDDGSERELV